MYIALAMGFMEFLLGGFYFLRPENLGARLQLCKEILTSIAFLRRAYDVSVMLRRDYDALNAPAMTEETMDRSRGASGVLPHARPKCASLLAILTNL